MSPFPLPAPFSLPVVPIIPRHLQVWVALGRRWGACAAAPGQSHPTEPPCLPQLSASATSSCHFSWLPQSGVSVPPMPGTPRGPCCRSPPGVTIPFDVLPAPLIEGGLLGAAGKGSVLPPGEKPLMETWAGSSPAHHRGRSPTGMGWARLWHGAGRKDWHVGLYGIKPSGEGLFKESEGDFFEGRRGPDHFLGLPMLCDLWLLLKFSFSCQK